MHCIACTAMILTCQLIKIVFTVLVTNQNENVGNGSFPGFGLGEELIDIMIAKKHHGAFEQYFFVINNLPLLNMQMQKHTTDMLPLV